MSEEITDNIPEGSAPSSPSIGAETKVKVPILLRATGDAPILGKKKWLVHVDQNVASIISFLKKSIKMDPSDSLFIYVNQSFAPSPDTTIRALFDSFATNGSLVLNYCKTQAWG
uniref:Ubiquitin-like protein ATG12 n=1 Tax=Cacopsylla melanoneura TaxID=428564 RepID=A0A8D9AWL9_9HEMI